MVGYANEGVEATKAKSVWVRLFVPTDWEILIANDGGQKEWRHSNIIQDKGEDVVVCSEDHKDNDYTDLVLNVKKHDGPTPVEEPDVPVGTVVAANEKGRFWGDPHFIGGDGGTFDVQGEPNKIYNILTDKNLIYHGLFIPAKDTKKAPGVTLVGRTVLTLAGKDAKSSVVFEPRSNTATVNGQKIPSGDGIRTADGGTTKMVGKNVESTTAEGYRIVQEFIKGSKVWPDYINADVHTGAKGVGSDGEMPEDFGITFDADETEMEKRKRGPRRRSDRRCITD